MAISESDVRAHERRNGHPAPVHPAVRARLRRPGLPSLRRELAPFDVRWYLVRALMGLIPPYTFGSLRPHLLRLGGWDVGRRCMFPDTPSIVGARPRDGRLRIGNGVISGTAPLFDLAADITIEDGVGIGHRVSFITGGHAIHNGPVRMGALAPKPIRICHGAWVSTGAIILPGVTVGASSVVAAGAVVTRDVPPNTLAGGVPARSIRQLPPPDANKRSRGS